MSDLRCFWKGLCPSCFARVKGPANVKECAACGAETEEWRTVARVCHEQCGVCKRIERTGESAAERKHTTTFVKRLGGAKA